MTAVPDTISQLDAALHYASRGWEVFPANPNSKAPLTDNGMKDATADLGQIRRWWTDTPGALIACRIPADIVVLDVDPRHGGDGTWDELERAYAPIEPRRTHISGRRDGGAHHWFDHPGGKLSAKKLHDWARKNGVGQAAGQRSWTSGIDILHHDHRYSILPPSPHPDTGQPYLWTARDEPGPMPGFLAALVTADPVSERPQLRPVHDSDSIADWYTSHTSWHDLLPRHGWVLVSGDGDSDGSKWRHPNASAESSASVRHGCLFVYSPNTDFDVTEDGDPRGITRFRAWATLEHGGNLSDAAKAARIMRDGEPPAPVALSDLIAAPPPHTSDLNLPDEFWLARPTLGHIRQAAHHRGRCADAVLLFALARVAALTPPTIALPAIVGGRASLNFLGGIVSSSGAGKSTANAVARDLIPIERKDVVADVPPGSGEGLTELFFEMVNEEGDDGKTRKVKRQTKNGALIYLDEGQALAEMGNRKGATLLPTLRSAWSGEVIGQSNATTETHRVLKAHSYRMAIVVGFQLEYASTLIDDAPGGTPQRFVFATATDPTVPDVPPAWPGELEVPPQPMIAGTEIDVDPDVRQYVWQRNIQMTRGEVQVGALDAHGDLVRLKIAALLALLEGRCEVTSSDWHLAGTIHNTSNAVRSWVISYARQKAAQTEQAMAMKLANRQVITDDTVEQRALTSGAKSIARKVHKAGGAASKRDLMGAAASKHKTLVSVDDMIAHAEQKGWIVPEGDGWKPGDSRPT